MVMRGVTYDIMFTKPNKDFVYMEDCDMENTLTTIKDLFVKYHNLDIRITNQIVYNLMRRPNTCNAIMTDRLTIEKHIKKKPCSCN